LLEQARKTEDRLLSDKAEQAAVAKLWDGTNRPWQGEFDAADVESGPSWRNEKGQMCRMVNRRIPGSGHGEKTNAKIHSNWFTLAEECDPLFSGKNMDGSLRTLAQEIEAEAAGAYGF
jgi:hypothetical protein